MYAFTKLLIITEFSKTNKYYKRILDNVDNVKIYVYGFREINTKSLIRYLLELR